MKKIILTSAGFENPVIARKFLELVGKDPQDIRALWIPTAAVQEDAIAMLPKCKNDLLNLGIKETSIVTYDLDRVISIEELQQYDAIYVCGGTTRYLASKMQEVSFTNPLQQYLQMGGLYVGVSAGSVVAAHNYDNGLSYVNCILSVHEKTGSPNGPLDLTECPSVFLTNNQAILGLGDKYTIIS